MATVKLFALVLLALILLALPTAWAAAGDVEQQIRTLQDQARDAALKGETAFLEKYLADDYEGIGGDGTPNTKDQAIRSA